jgi:hypothetical protein
MLAIYMPIIRFAVASYVEVWNCHWIRRDRKRKNHVAGNPKFLYQHLEIDRYGQPVDVNLIAELDDDFTDWGKLFLFLCAFPGLLGGFQYFPTYPAVRTSPRYLFK